MGNELHNCNFTDLTYFIRPITKRMVEMRDYETSKELAIRLNNAIDHLNNACIALSPNFYPLPVLRESDLPVRKQKLLGEALTTLNMNIAAAIENDEEGSFTSSILRGMKDGLDRIMRIREQNARTDIKGTDIKQMDKRTSRRSN